MLPGIGKLLKIIKWQFGEALFLVGPGSSILGEQGVVPGSKQEPRFLANIRST